MARKQRSRSRTATRRATQPAPPEAAAEPRPTTAPRRSGASGTPSSARGAIASRTGALRAAGTPSAALLRNAEWERAHVVRDFRRIGAVVVLMAVLLVVADIAVNLLFK